MDFVTFCLKFDYEGKEMQLFCGKIPYWLAAWTANTFPDKKITKEGILKLENQLELFYSDAVLQQNSPPLAQAIEESKWLLSEGLLSDMKVIVGAL